MRVIESFMAAGIVAGCTCDPIPVTRDPPEFHDAQASDAARVAAAFAKADAGKIGDAARSVMSVGVNEQIADANVSRRWDAPDVTCDDLFAQACKEDSRAQWCEGFFAAVCAKYYPTLETCGDTIIPRAASSELSECVRASLDANGHRSSLPDTAICDSLPDDIDCIPCGSYPNEHGGRDFDCRR